MNTVKQLLAAVLALCLCLSFAACAADSQTAEEALFSQAFMKGVEHDGLKIKVDSANTNQIMYAASYLSKDSASEAVEGYEKLRSITLYYKTSADDGQWYCPTTVMMPCESAGDVFISNYCSCSATFGNIQLSLQPQTLLLTEGELSGLRQTEDWAELSDKQIYLAMVAEASVSNLGLDDEQAETRYNDDFAFVTITTDQDGIERTIYIQTSELDQGVNGAYTVSTALVVIDGLDQLTQEERLVLDEIMDCYNLHQWFE